MAGECAAKLAGTCRGVCFVVQLPCETSVLRARCVSTLHNDQYNDQPPSYAWQFVEYVMADSSCAAVQAGCG